MQNPIDFEQVDAFEHFSGSLDDAVAMLARSYPAYSVNLVDGVVIARHKDLARSSPLDRILPLVEFRDVSIFKAVAQVCKLAGGMNAGIDSAEHNGGLAQNFGHVTLKLKNVRVVDALNAIVRADKRSIWFAVPIAPNLLQVDVSSWRSLERAGH
jgi:hypothetical protein